MTYNEIGNREYVEYTSTSTQTWSELILGLRNSVDFSKLTYNATIVQTAGSSSVRLDIYLIRGNKSIFTTWYMNQNGTIGGNCISFDSSKAWQLYNGAVTDNSTTQTGAAIKLRLYY